MTNLASYFAAVPGLTGHTIISDPSLLIRNVHGSVADVLAEKIEQIPGVRFTFPDVGNIIVLLEEPSLSRTVEAQVNQLIDEYQLVELRFPWVLKLIHSR